MHGDLAEATKFCRALAEETTGAGDLPMMIMVSLCPRHPFAYQGERLPRTTQRNRA